MIFISRKKCLIVTLNLIIEIISNREPKLEKSPRKNKYTKGGSEEYKKLKARHGDRMTMKALVVAEPGRARLFNRKNTDKGQNLEFINFPGLIVDDQMTKFNICIQCCEVFSLSAIPKELSHASEGKTDILSTKPIESIERRTEIHKSHYSRQYFTELNVETIKCN